MQIYAENDEITNQIIDSNVGQGLEKLASSGLLKELHITDLKKYNGFPLFLRAVIIIPSDPEDAEGFKKMSELIQMVIYIVDLVAKV